MRISSMGMSYVFFTFVVTASIFMGSQQSVLGATYNVGADWSNTQNPNGVWSYNQGETPLPYNGIYFGIAGEVFWNDSTGYPPTWNKAATTPDFADADDWAPGDVIAHSRDTQSPLVNITWTSPGAGTINISGLAWDAFHYASRDDGWGLMLNDTLLAEQQSIYGINRDEDAALFASNILAGQFLNGLSVNANDIVMFYASANTDPGHFVGVDLTIEFSPSDTPTIPEPTSLLLLGTGLGLIGLTARRSRK